VSQTKKPDTIETNQNHKIMNSDIITSIENKEDGMTAVISKNYKFGFNVILIDADSGQSLGGKVGIADYNDAEEYANFIVNI